MSGRPDGGRVRDNPIAALRAGELLALAGVVCVGLSLALPWYDGPPGSGTKLGAWSTFGASLVLMIVSAALGLVLVLANLAARSPAVPVACAIWSSAFGIVGAVAALIRVLERPAGGEAVSVGGWVGLAGALAILAGSWQSMRDERTDLYPPPDLPPPRPAPPAGGTAPGPTGSPARGLESAP